MKNRKNRDYSVSTTRCYQICNAEHIPSVTSTVLYRILGLSTQKVSLKGGGDGTEPVTYIYIYRKIRLVNRVETEVRAQTSNIDLACYVQLSQYIVAPHICRIPHTRIYHHYRDMMLTSVTIGVWTRLFLTQTILARQTVIHFV